jgi:nicotinamidase-related amidase
VSTTVRGRVEHNYRIILVRDAVAEVNRATHEAELETTDRVFADVRPTDEVVALLAGTEEVG